MKSSILFFIAGCFIINQIGRFFLGNGITVVLLDVFVCTAVALYFLMRVSQIKKITKDSIGKWVVVFFVICIASLALNIYRLSFQQLIASVLYPVRWVLYAGVLFIIRNFSFAEKRFVSYLMLWIGALIVGIGYVQYFYYPYLKNLYYLGWDDHLYRMFSVFLDPNFAGIFFVLYFIFLLGNVFIATTSRVRIILGLQIVITFIAVFLTFSRTSIIMLVISTSIFLLLQSKLKLLIPLMFSILLFFLLASPFFYLENINFFRHASSIARIESARHAVQIFKDNWLFGVGFNSYRYAQIHYGFRTTISGLQSHADAGTDNSYLFVGATTGIFGILVYLFLLGTIITQVYQRFKKEKKVYQTVFLASCGGILFSSMFINSLFYPSIMLWLWVLLGLSDYK